MEPYHYDCLPVDVLVHNVRIGWHHVYKYFLHNLLEGYQWYQTEEFEGSPCLERFRCQFTPLQVLGNPQARRQLW